MIIDDQNIQSIYYRNDEVCIIDQTLLPHTFEIVTLDTLADACAAITSMQVRGAPLIGVTAAYGIYLALREGLNLQDSARQLLGTRPTAVNLHWAIERVLMALQDLDGVTALAKALELAQELEAEDSAICAAIGEHGADLLSQLWESKRADSSAATGRKPETLNILTHCNAGFLATVDWGTALSVVYKLKERGVPLHVWVDETRPRNQGASLTCWELSRLGISHDLIVDNTGGHLMQQGEVDACIVGSDRTTANGDVCNKIGTYLKALAAKDNDVPFYAAVPLSTIDFALASGASIPIEMRSADEVTHITGRDDSGELRRVQLTGGGTTAVNYAFDVTPARLISAIVTERGVFDASTSGLATLRP